MHQYCRRWIRTSYNSARSVLFHNVATNCNIANGRTKRWPCFPNRSPTSSGVKHLSLDQLKKFPCSCVDIFERLPSCFLLSVWTEHNCSSMYDKVTITRILVQAADLLQITCSHVIVSNQVHSKDVLLCQEAWCKLASASGVFFPRHLFSLLQWLKRQLARCKPICGLDLPFKTFAAFFPCVSKSSQIYAVEMLFALV